MFKRILVPLDGSARAERALLVAAHAARAAHGTLVLARLVTPSASYAPFVDVPLENKSLFDDEVAAAQGYLREVAARPELAGVATEIIAVLAAAVGPELVELAEELRADLIVLCSHGRSGMLRLALGSVAQQVVRHSPIPTLVLSAKVVPVATGGPQTGRCFRVLVPLDGSQLAEAAIEPAARLAAAISAPGGGEVVLLNVIGTDETNASGPSSAQAQRTGRRLLLENVQTYLSLVAEGFECEPLASLGVRVSTSVVVSNDVAKAIARVAAGGEGDAAGRGVFDTIAMATHGWSGLRLLAMGSVTDRVLTMSKCPLVVVRPPHNAGWDRMIVTEAKRAAGSSTVSPVPFF